MTIEDEELLKHAIDFWNEHNSIILSQHRGILKTEILIVHRHINQKLTVGGHFEDCCSIMQDCRCKHSRCFCYEYYTALARFRNMSEHYFRHDSSNPLCESMEHCVCNISLEDELNRQSLKKRH